MAGIGNHLVLFLRAPRIGGGKTRLASGVGVVEAMRFQRQVMDKMVRGLGNDPRWITWLALTPDRYASIYNLRATKVFLMQQGGGNLGKRMNNVLCTLPPGPAIICGGDVPEITRDHIVKAFRGLKSYDLVFGPAEDGGFWLIGSRRGRTHSRFISPLLNNIRWSTKHALQDTLMELHPCLKIGWLDTLADVDTYEDYKRWLARTRSGAIFHLR